MTLLCANDRFSLSPNLSFSVPCTVSPRTLIFSLSLFLSPLSVLSHLLSVTLSLSLARTLSSFLCLSLNCHTLFHISFSFLFAKSLDKQQTMWVEAGRSERREEREMENNKYCEKRGGRGGNTREKSGEGRR